MGMRITQRNLTKDELPELQAVQLAIKSLGEADFFVDFLALENQAVWWHQHMYSKVLNLDGGLHIFFSFKFCPHLIHLIPFDDCAYLSKGWRNMCKSDVTWQIAKIQPLLA